MGYSLLASESTVQVLSASLVVDVLYCTIQTSESGVIASIAIPSSGNVIPAGDNGLLVLFSEAIDGVMRLPHVIAGTGQQTIDANGLLTDNVVFTVQYVPAGSTPTQITAEALVPVEMLQTSKSVSGIDPDLTQATAIIDSVYSSLEAAATG